MYHSVSMKPKSRLKGSLFLHTRRHNKVEISFGVKPLLHLMNELSFFCERDPSIRSVCNIDVVLLSKMNLCSYLVRHRVSGYFQEYGRHPRKI